MAELNLKQITDKLNTEFVGQARKLVFWYDENAEFLDDVDALPLQNATVYHLQPDNQFHTKYLLERVDTTTNYLIYAPFAKPPLPENHLADTLRYSVEFFADRVSLLALDLGIAEQDKPALKEHIKFFAAKERTQKFYELAPAVCATTEIEVTMMSALCKLKTASFEEVLRVILSEPDLTNSLTLAEFARYDLTQVFWAHCKTMFAYQDTEPTLVKFVNVLFATYTCHICKATLPEPLSLCCTAKEGTVIAFIDGMMHNVLYQAAFERLAKMAYLNLGLQTVLEKLSIDDFAALELFYDVDAYLIRWMVARLVAEDTQSKIAGETMDSFCKSRLKLHYGNVYAAHYQIVQSAYFIMQQAHFAPEKTVAALWKHYVAQDHQIDANYRQFYLAYDSIQNPTQYEELRELIENIYTNDYLNVLSPTWVEAFAQAKTKTGMVPQHEFYSKYISGAKERVVVIISDALRYEVATSLLNRLMEDERCTVAISSMQSVVPSYTRLGMAALLPHSTIALNKSFQVLVDGKPCDDLKAREHALQRRAANSKAIQFNDLKEMKVSDLRDFCTGQSVIYIYHDQIDARSHKLSTENSIFNACEDTINDLYSMIKRLASANNTRFFITADHGFLYKRETLAESDKISGIEKKNAFVGRRYVVAEKPVTEMGVMSVCLGDVLNTNDSRVVSVPMGSDVFKTAGGQNFAHGGASLQEIVVPLIDIKINKGKQEVSTVPIALVSLVRKITNLTTNLDFIQSEAVSDVCKETRYRIFVADNNGEKVSNEVLYTADNKEADASKRVFRIRLIFKNKQYDNSQTHYLMAVDEKTGLACIQQEVQMDLAFADDYGFNA